MPVSAERPNPAPGPKFDYKLSWFERLTSYAQRLLDSGAPVVLAGDFNVMPTELDALRVLHPGERIYTFWKYFRNAFARDAGLQTVTSEPVSADYSLMHGKIQAFFAG